MKRITSNTKLLQQLLTQLQNAATLELTCDINHDPLNIIKDEKKIIKLKKYLEEDSSDYLEGMVVGHRNSMF